MPSARQQSSSYERSTGFPHPPSAPPSQRLVPPVVRLRDDVRSKWLAAPMRGLPGVLIIASDVGSGSPVRGGRAARFLLAFVEAAGERELAETLLDCPVPPNGGFGQAEHLFAQVNQAPSGLDCWGGMMVATYRPAGADWPWLVLTVTGVPLGQAIRQRYVAVLCWTRSKAVEQADAVVRAARARGYAEVPSGAGFVRKLSGAF